MLFAKCGKDEIRVGNGEKIALGLGSFGRSLAPDSAGADGDERLLGLVSAAPGVVVGVHKTGEPGLLVGLEHLAAGPHAGHQGQAAGSQDQRLAQVDAAQKEPRNQDGRIGEGGSQIRLLQNQQHGNTHQRERLENILPGERAPAQIRKVAGHHQNQNQLDPLGWLKLQGADLDPAFGAQRLVPHGQHRQQRHNAHPIGPGSEVDHLVIIDLGKEKHGRQAADDPENLLGVEADILCVQGGGVDLQH